VASEDDFDFDAEWYLEQNPDVRLSGLDPLTHFLEEGRAQGRKPNSHTPSPGGPPVTRARIETIKEPVMTKEVALFVTYSAKGYLKRHVVHYLDSLRRQDILVLLVINTDSDLIDAGYLSAHTYGCFKRENKGYDFGAWAHLLRNNYRLYMTDILYLLNDSLIGPFNDALFGDLIGRIRASTADVVGLTENIERGAHLQSYFLAIKSRALRSPVFTRFFESVVSYADKRDIINEYEIRFSSIMKSEDLTCECLFPVDDFRNPTFHHWRTLIEQGFPFIKVETAAIISENWQKLVAERGYDVALAECAAAERDA
jgi:lipopolysaccharide biosynthesis protein